MPQFSFHCGHGYLLAEHPTSGGRIYPNFGFFKFQLWTPKSWYMATGVPADICKWDHELLLSEPIAKSAQKRAREWRCRGTKRAASVRRRILIAQARRHAFRARPRVVLQLVAQMFRISRIVFSLWIRIRQHRMPRQRLDGKRVGRVEIEILFEAVGIEEIIANPSSWQCRKRLRIKIKLQSLAGAENDKAIIGGVQQIEHVAVARVISRRARIRTGHAPVRIRIDRVACRLQPDLARIADEIERHDLFV